MLLRSQVDLTSGHITIRRAKDGSTQRYRLTGETPPSASAVAQVHARERGTVGAMTRGDVLGEELLEELRPHALRYARLSDDLVRREAARGWGRWEKRAQKWAQGTVLGGLARR